MSNFIVEHYLSKSKEICDFVSQIIPELKVVHGTYADTSYLSTDTSPKPHTWLQGDIGGTNGTVIIDPMAKYIGNNGVIKNYQIYPGVTDIERVNKFVSELDFTIIPDKFNETVRNRWELEQLEDSGLFVGSTWFKFKFSTKTYITETITSYWSNDLEDIVSLIIELLDKLNKSEKLTIDISHNDTKVDEELSYIIVNIIRLLFYKGKLTKSNFYDKVTIVGSPIILNLDSLVFNN